jgi:hypothetical protein
MFGKDAPAHEQPSEDEDWGPSKRKRREKESDAASTLMTLYESKRRCKNDATIEGMMKLPRDPQIRRPIFRLPPDAVEVVVFSKCIVRESLFLFLFINLIW